LQASYELRARRVAGRHLGSVKLHGQDQRRRGNRFTSSPNDNSGRDTPLKAGGPARHGLALRIAIDARREGSPQTCAWWRRYHPYTNTIRFVNDRRDDDAGLPTQGRSFPLIVADWLADLSGDKTHDCAQCRVITLEEPRLPPVIRQRSGRKRSVWCSFPGRPARASPAPLPLLRSLPRPIAPWSGRPGSSAISCMGPSSCARSSIMPAVPNLA
jgi:hypothetical protein